MAMPIMTFDERVLSPSYGYVFQRRWLQPYESIVGMLWKFARMNRLPGHAAVMHLGRGDVDPYAGLDFSEVDVALLARLFGITQRAVRAALSNAQRDVCPDLRYCAKCMGQAFHSGAQQLMRHARCPIHGQPLQSACGRCQRPSLYWLDAQLLDAPFKCRHCRAPYCAGGTPTSPARWTLARPERAAVTRASLGLPH